MQTLCSKISLTGVSQARQTACLCYINEPSLYWFTQNLPRGLKASVSCWLRLCMLLAFAILLL